MTVYVSCDHMTSLAAACRPLRLIVTGGGTGGHVYPALTVARAAEERLADFGIQLEMLWVGAANSMEERVAADEGIRFQAVATGKIRRDRNPLKMISAANVRDVGRVPLGIAQAYAVVSRFAPDAVLSTGGYVALPVGIATWANRRPLVVHEQTSRLGLANRVLAHAATRVAISWEASRELLPRRARRTAVLTGNPVRPDLLTGVAQRALQAPELTGFDPNLPTLYVTGGAQGSVQINGLVQENLDWLLTRANVIHQCGGRSLDALRAHGSLLPANLAKRYVVTDFIGSELPDVLALADIAVARSGAGTLAEFTALGMPSVQVPLTSSAGNEQVHNAQSAHRAGAAVALCGNEATAENLRTALAPLLEDTAARLPMSRQARAMGKPGAAQRLTDLLLDVMRPRACRPVDDRL
ncbi:glycosyltransferase [Streptomyces vinaceus]|uniref:UDP-N-acetylglucosamine--N-acetylmuramyl- (pentapeptide) pyrophosphoryl-undecaprenol N-acetylglucosamine transferase n=1 Tax=Streptomyces vinaceus TaxID=1960 RepID=UPI0035D59313